MPRMPDVLEGASRSVDLEPGGFERLLHRRERKQRNRRILAGALGVIVAVATGIVLARSLMSDGVPADPPPTPAPVGAGEVLRGMGRDLFAHDPDSGEVRKIVQGEALPEGAESITSAGWSPSRNWVAFRLGLGSWTEASGSPTPSAALRDSSPRLGAILLGPGHPPRTNSSSCTATM